MADGIRGLNVPEPGKLAAAGKEAASQMKLEVPAHPCIIGTRRHALQGALRPGYSYAGVGTVIMLP